MTLVVAAVALALMAQQPPVPRPFPQPGSTTSTRPSAPEPAQPTTTDAPPPGENLIPAEAPPSEAMLGVPLYPGAQFIASYDAGRGQRFYLFGTSASFEMLVSYYRTMLTERGDLVFEVPATHQFDVGRFREDEMAFPPGVTIKDFQSSLSGGYPNPDPDGQPPRFPSIIQIVPVPPQR